MLEGLTVEELQEYAAALRYARLDGLTPASALTDDESELIGESLIMHCGIIRATAARYYRGKCADVRGAVDWIQSELCDYVIDRVISGAAAIPVTGQRWIGFLKPLFPRYFAELQEGQIGGIPIRALADDDTGLQTLLRANSLQLDDDALFATLCEYAAAAGMLTERIAETIAAWVWMPHATYAERAAAFGVGFNGWKSRERDAMQAVRAGAIAAVIGFHPAS